jgi:hypothetical protein
MNNTLAIYFLCLISASGVLAFLSVIGYEWLVIFALIIGVMAIRMMKRKENRLLFCGILAIDAVAGVIIHFTPHELNGGVSGVGILVILSALFGSQFCINKIRKSELVASATSQLNVK